MTVTNNAVQNNSGLTGAWSDRDVVLIEGPDSASFLQGQLSQDIAALEVGTSAWSLLLAPTGKVVAHLRVHRVGEERFLADVAAGFSEDVVTRLNRFKIRVKCEIADIGPWPVLSVRGGHPSADDPIPEGVIVAPAEGSSIGLLGYEVIPLDGSTAHVIQPEGLTLDADAVEQLRISSGVPAMGAEIDDSVIPAEMGAWFVEESVSWTKGCYTGQELVARVDSRGSNTPRRLWGLHLSGVATAGDVATVDDIDRGRVTSVFGEQALAVLHRSVAAGEVISIGDSGATATVVALPA